MAGSVCTIFRWSILRMSSAVLILLWAFNPLGSQASFRGVYLRSVTGSSQGNIIFYDARLSTQVSLSRLFSWNGPNRPTLSALYTSSLYDSVSNIQYVDTTSQAARDIVSVIGGKSSAGIQAATDVWGNIRIPHHRYLSNYDPKDRQKWLETPWDKKILNYTSLFGERVKGVNRSFTGNTTFTITSSYQDLHVGLALFIIWAVWNWCCMSNANRIWVVFPMVQSRGPRPLRS